MTRSSSSSSSSWLAITTLTILCITAAVIISNSTIKSTTSTRRSISKNQITRQTASTTSRGKISSNSKTRNMVGGFANMDTELLQSEEVATIASFALMEHAAGKSPDSSSTILAVLPEEVESGVVQMKVLEAQRQVVAGLNYKLTIAIFKSNICRGAFKVTVYKPLPHMEQGLTVTSWGSVLQCSEITELLQDATEREESKALVVEKERKEVVEEVEPDS